MEGGDNSCSTPHLFCSVFAAGKKKNVNVGNRGGTAGLDDYKFDQPLDDDYDFM